MSLMTFGKHRSLRDFLVALELRGELKRVTFPVNPQLEITEISQRVLKRGGPALLFEHPAGSNIPVLTNLFGTTQRIALGMGRETLRDMREIGQILAFLKQPRLPKGMRDTISKLSAVKKLLDASPKVLSSASCREVVVEGNDVDLSQLPIQTQWPGDAGPLITFGLVVTRGPYKERQNIGIYRQQVIDRNKVIMRWLHHRGGAQDYCEWQKEHPGERFPLNVVIGADPATLLAAVTPIPDTISEFQFAGLLRGARTEVIEGIGNDLFVPVSAEIVLEGYIAPGEEHDEGPFGDHTGYYNSVQRFPVFTVERICHRPRPIYHSTYMGRSPYDEPSVLSMALNEVFIPLLQVQFPEIVDFYLPPEACSYRVAVVSIKKAYPGHARRIMFGIWSYLRQFTYTKLVIITDDDINSRDWKEVIWALVTRVDPARDTLIVENTPIDYLDFASPQPGLGSKMGFDATNKWPGETSRDWGQPIAMSREVEKRIDQIWSQLGID